MKISDIKLKIIPDSRGDDTLEVEFYLGDIFVIASVPSGKSKGALEAFVLEPKLALEKFNQIKNQILEGDFESVDDFDKFLIYLDGTSGKKNLGGNLTLVLSIGFTKLLARIKNVEPFELISQITKTKMEKFPLMLFNLIEGGVHAKDSLPFQEYLFIPQVNSPDEGLRLALLGAKLIEDKIHQGYGMIEHGDEGGFSVPSKNPMDGLDVLLSLIKYESHPRWAGIDAAASTFYKDGKYLVGEKLYTRNELIEFYTDIASKFPILYLEDIFDEEDWEGFSAVLGKVGEKVWLVGDDLTTTNTKRIQIAQDKKAINAVIIKPTQIGTMTETIQAAQLAKSYGWKIIVSHRSGETKDFFIADLAVGLGADGLKAGCPLKEERMVKYQRLIQIESHLRFYGFHKTYQG